jgi:hypothetical protein
MGAEPLAADGKAGQSSRCRTLSDRFRATPRGCTRSTPCARRAEGAARTGSGAARSHAAGRVQGPGLARRAGRAPAPRAPLRAAPARPLPLPGLRPHDLQRACIVLSRRPRRARVILLGRLSLYGERAARLHDEILAVAARVDRRRPQGAAGPTDDETLDKTLALLERALSAEQRDRPPQVRSAPDVQRRARPRGAPARTWRQRRVSWPKRRLPR